LELIAKDSAIAANRRYMLDALERIHPGTRHSLGYPPIHFEALYYLDLPWKLASSNAPDFSENFTTTSPPENVKRKRYALIFPTSL